MSKAKERVKKLLERLDKEIENIKNSEEFQEMLNFFSKFHNYSYNNIILIQSQCPNAKLVKGYKQWKKLDRYVMPREKREKKEGVRVEPIRILAPQFYNKKVTAINKENKEEVKKIRDKAENNKTYKIEETKNKVILKQEKIYFKYVNVYDISQTDGEPIPTLDIDLKDDFPALIDPLKDFCHDNNINLQFKSKDEDIKLKGEGYSKDNKIVVNKEKNITTQASILIHEIAHNQLHKNLSSKEKKELTKEIIEIEAETTAYIVLKHFNIDSTSDKYLSMYKKDYDLKNSLNRVNKTAQKIINHCDNYFNENKEDKTA